jgi:hypothetical protein
MDAWLNLGLLSAVTGGIATKVFKGRTAILAGGAAAWFGMLAWLLYNEYFVPYQGGGASMWPIAQLFGGTFAAVVAAGTAAILVATRPAKQSPRQPSVHGNEGNGEK